MARSEPSSPWLVEGVEGTIPDVTQDDGQKAPGGRQLMVVHERTPHSTANARH